MAAHTQDCVTAYLAEVLATGQALVSILLALGNVVVLKDFVSFALGPRGQGFRRGVADGSGWDEVSRERRLSSVNWNGPCCEQPPAS